MHCSYCNVSVSSSHDVSPNHIKNVLFYNYSIDKRKYTGNRKGIIVTCDVESAKQTMTDYKHGNIVVSIMPDQVAKFSFKVLNETNAEDILVVGVDIATKKLNFSMSDHPFIFGEDPYNLSPKKAIPNNISVRFSSPIIGQYNMPIMFLFKKTINDEPLIIVRDMIVFVENNPVTHEEIDSPFFNKDVSAEFYVHATTGPRIRRFPIPKVYKSMFSNKLKLPENATVQEVALYNTVNRSFEVGVTEMNLSTFFHNLLWYEEFTAKANLRRYNMNAQSLKLLPNMTYELTVPGLAEKRPSLMKGDIVKVKPLYTAHSVIYEGVAISIHENQVILGKFCPEFHRVYQYNGTFDFAFMMNTVCLERMHAAVGRLDEVDQMCRVFPTSNLKSPNIKSIDTWLNPLIGGNSEQRRAVEHIVSGSAGAAPYILHGPPGTGKTVTIVEAILQLVMKNKKNRILVCTESNMAADHVACSLLQYKQKFGDKFLIRANSNNRDKTIIPEVLEAYSKYYPDTKELVKHCRIVVTTLSHAAVYESNNSGITHLFIDEAGQASEPACLVPVTSLLGAAGAMVLAGDHKQLGPVVMSRDAANKGLSLSLMERLMDTNHLYQERDPRYTVMLRQNFRSHPDILEIPNDLFYEGQLSAHAAADPLSTTDILGNAETSRAIVFHGCSSTEHRMGKSPSFFNEMELTLTYRYITALVQKLQVLPKDIGVVTPYYRQAQRIKNWLSENELSAIEVGTVEAFQGKEKRVIIISTVRANSALLDHDARFQLGFLVDDKRFNVALTRAKAKLIIIGNPLCLQLDDKWKMFMSKCRTLNTYVGFDPVIERNPKIIEDLKQAAKRVTEISLDK